MIPFRPAASCSEILKRRPESITESLQRLTEVLIFKPESILLFIDEPTGARANLYIYTRVRQLICYCVFATNKELYRVKESRGLLKRGPSVITFWLKKAFTRERVSDQFRVDLWFEDHPEARLQRTFKVALY
jgi:hypothetical protein